MVWRSNGIKNKSLKGKMDGKRSRSRPKQRWFDGVNDNLNKSSQRTVLVTVESDEEM